MRQVLTKFLAAFLNGRRGFLLLVCLPSMRQIPWPDGHALVALPGDVAQSGGASISPRPTQ